MNIALIVVVAFVLFDILLVWSMCVVSTRADRRMEEMRARAISGDTKTDAARR